MNLIRRQIASLLMLIFMAQILWGCGAPMSTTRPEFSTPPGYATPAPGNNESSNPDYAYAQATMDYGKSQLLELSRRATEVSLNMSQAANAAAQATQEYNQRQQMELDYQATLVNQNIAQAAATQQFINQQTKLARDGTAAAQSRAATAAHSASLLKVNQTSQAAAAFTAFPLTATPFAATQAALLMQQYDREQQSFLDRVVSPLIPIFATTLVLLLFVLVIVLVYRRLMPVPWARHLQIARLNVHRNPLNMIDGVIVDHDPQLHQIVPHELTPTNLPGLPGENTVHVEIVDATEPPVAHWIAEVEHQLANVGRL